MPPPPRRVAVFTGHFLPNLGGVEIYSWQLWRRLVGRGWQVLLVTSDVGGGPAEEVVDGIQVLRLRSLVPVDPRFPLPLPSRLFRRLDAFGPAGVVTNLRFMPPCWLGAGYARRRGLPHLHIEHGSNAVRSGKPLVDWTASAVDQTLGRWLVRGARRCVGVSPASAAFVASLGAEAPGLLTAGIEPPALPADARRRWREAQGLSPAAVAMLFLGRVTTDKGVEVLLDAWARLEALEQAHLIVVGAGPALPEVTRRAASLRRVHLLGPVAPGEVATVMTGCDLLVHPSLASEGLPLTVLEAAATGLPVISTPQGVEGHLVESGAHGLIVPPGDAQALASALREAVADRPGWAERGRRLQEATLRRYGWQQVLDNAERELTRLLEGRPG